MFLSIVFLLIIERKVLMKKERLTIENRMLIEQLLKLNYKLKNIADAIDSTSSTVSREIKKRRICSKGNLKECDKLKRFPYVCSCCNLKVNCHKKKYYYNYKKAQENYDYLLHYSRKGIDMSIDELEYWNDYLTDKLKNKNQPILHLYNTIENEFPKSIQTFYNYVHGGYFSNINDEMLPRSYSYKPRKRKDEAPTIRYDNPARTGRTLKELEEYLTINPNANIVEMDTVIGKFEDKKCILTLYFRNSKLMLMFLINKYKTSEVKRIFNCLRKKLGIEKYKELFEIILTDNGWEFSKPSDIEIDPLTDEKTINVFYCEPYSSWQKGGIERNHEFIRYIIPKGITFDNLSNENITCMMNNINNIKRKSMDFKTPYSIFTKIYGEKISKTLHLHHIDEENVDLSYRILK